MMKEYPKYYVHKYSDAYWIIHEHKNIIDVVYSNRLKKKSMETQHTIKNNPSFSEISIEEMVLRY